MSAHIVTDRHISAMLEIVNPQPGRGLTYYWDREHHTFKGYKRGVGQKLLDQNYRSVNRRYNYDEGDLHFTHFHHEDPGYKPDPVQAIKLCDCYMYQASETPDWKDTEAFAIVNALRENAIMNLNGYRWAPWSL